MSIGHNDKSDFDPAKFRPSHIYKIDICLEDLTEYFLSGHPLTDCAKKFGCSATTIKRRLRSAGVDTSIYNHSAIAKQRSVQAHSVQLPSDDELKVLLVDNNLDTKTVAEQYGVHFNTIRKKARQLAIKKSPKDISRSMMARHHRIHGCAHPAQRPDVIIKTRRSAQRARYRDVTFRSLHGLSYALFLDSLGFEWYYEEMRIQYVDMMTGKWRSYVIDFTVVDSDAVWWIEVKPNEQMIPTDKRIYTERRAEAAGVIYRGTTWLERQLGWSILCSGLCKSEIEFLRPKPRRNNKQITYWFTDHDEANRYHLPGWTKHTIIRHSDCLFALKLKQSK